MPPADERKKKMEEKKIIYYNGVEIKQRTTGTYELFSPVNGTQRLFSDLSTAKYYIDNAHSMDNTARLIAKNPW